MGHHFWLLNSLYSISLLLLIILCLGATSCHGIDYRRVLWGSVLPLLLRFQDQTRVAGLAQRVPLSFEPYADLLSFFLFPSFSSLYSLLPSPLSSFPVLFKDGIDGLMLYRLFSNS